MLLDEVVKDPTLFMTCDEETRRNVLERTVELMVVVAARMTLEEHVQLIAALTARLEDEVAGRVTETASTETMYLWINDKGETITLDNQDLTDPKDSRLQILQFRENAPATEIILGPSDLQELRDAILEED
jgi:hypothetical protein